MKKTMFLGAVLLLAAGCQTVVQQTTPFSQQGKIAAQNNNQQTNVNTNTPLVVNTTNIVKDQTTYNNFMQGYSVSYPNNWFVNFFHNSEFGYQLLIGEPNNNGFSYNINVYNDSIDSVINKVSVDHGYSGKPVDVNINGIIWKKLQNTSENGSLADYITEKGGKIFDIGATQDSALPAFLKNFKFIN